MPLNRTHDDGQRGPFYGLTVKEYFIMLEISVFLSQVHMVKILWLWVRHK